MKVDHVYSANLEGLHSKIIKVEVTMKRGIPRFSIVGLAATSIKESTDRVRAALESSGYEFPLQSIIVNLSPAGIRKDGSWIDLAIAAGILKNSYQIDCSDAMQDIVCVGELGLDGSVKPMRGLVNILLSMKDAGYRSVVVPQENHLESSLISGLQIYPIARLEELEGVLKEETRPIQVKVSIEEKKEIPDSIELYEEQLVALRALTISVTGKHHFLLFGNPGVGKTMLARLAASLQPPLTEDEYIGLLRIRSASGYLAEEDAQQVQRPFRSPHHTASDISLVGGGRDIRMGEVTLAHQGILFLDELGEFNPGVIQALREPLEEGKITISRVTGHYTYPADFLLLAATNPCPCGYYGSSIRECTCSMQKVRRYLNRFSGPFLDRIDLQVEVSLQDLAKNKQVRVNLYEIYQRVVRAKEMQNQRFQGEPYAFNGMAKGEIVETGFRLHTKAQQAWNALKNNPSYSIRRLYKIKRISRTIADLAGEPDILPEHIYEAINFNRGTEYLLGLVA
ncbi:MAG: YifB family Mg chelatase-like AAA ATPase [Spirochaetota bacterium]